MSLREGVYGMEGCGMGTAYCLGLATFTLAFLFCSVKRKARRMLPEVAEWLMERPRLIRTPASRFAVMALIARVRVRRRRGRLDNDG